MPAHDETAAMLEAIQERISSGSGEDLAHARIRYLEDANRTMVRARSIDGVRIARLEGLLIDYEREIGLVRAARDVMVEDEVRREVEHPRRSDLEGVEVDALRSELALLRRDYADIEEQFNAALGSKAKLRAELGDAVREKHGLDSSRRIVDRDDPSERRH